MITTTSALVRTDFFLAFLASEPFVDFSYFQYYKITKLQDYFLCVLNKYCSNLNS